MNKFIKRIVLLPLWLILFVLLIPIDLIGLFFDQDPIGIDLLDWSWD